MFISNSYFKGNIHIPNSEDTAPNSNLLGNKSELNLFIEEYGLDVLLKCFGFSFFKLFKAQFDVDEQTNAWTLKSGVDSKWDDLLNGKEYQIDGVDVKWQGLIFKEGNFKRSLVAYYIYYHFLSNDVETYVGTGVQSEKSKNSVKSSSIPKAVRSWRKFYELTVGGFKNSAIIHKTNGVGIDWLNCNNGEKSLYQFIQDMNNVNTDTYPNWRPYFFENLNQLGI